MVIASPQSLQNEPKERQKRPCERMNKNEPDQQANNPPLFSFQIDILRILKLLFGSLAFLGFFGGTTGYIYLKNPGFEGAATPTTNISVEQKRLKKDVVFLTKGPRLRGITDIKGLNRAADYIKKQLTLPNIRLKEQTYTIDKKKQRYRNIIASVGPKGGKRIIVGAHYDVCGDTPGADDNASGVAGLLELVRMFAKNKVKLQLGIDLIAYTLEEPPYFRTRWMGSAVHARSLVKAKTPVRAMVSLEMLGFFSDKKNSQTFPFKPLRMFYPTTGNFIAVIGNQTLAGRELTRHFRNHMKAASKLPVQSMNSHPSLAGVDFSDHLNYWKHHFPAIMVTDTSFFRNKHYHKVTDRIETLDFRRMSEVVRGVYWALLQLAQTP